MGNGLTKCSFFCSSICVSLLRLVVRTQGFHPCNTGSTPVGDVARKGTVPFRAFFLYRRKGYEEGRFYD